MGDAGCEGFSDLPQAVTVPRTVKEKTNLSKVIPKFSDLPQAVMVVPTIKGNFD